ncbi:hypothetical protein TSOC_015068 [Tetrabaena socialis]|uniref:Uncharacterized protein n=1 Tax=Tetrabaena socialis TaxID=47790 RepID=A0A2J7ZFW0_9CHLO|nr:hypothetical protein TSOC_015068 [Tetrabaena socialis]|eukprot:PNG99160.1 hypothetical protein TSOC_015068 [Tetrabaena socialis]
MRQLIDDSPGKDKFGFPETFIIIASCPGNLHTTFNRCSGKNVIFCPVNFDPTAQAFKAEKWFANWRQNIHEAVKACKNNKFCYVEPRTQTVLWDDTPGCGGHTNIRLVAIDDGDPSHVFCKVEREELARDFRMQGTVSVTVSPRDLYDHLMRVPAARQSAALRL